MEDMLRRLRILRGEKPPAVVPPEADPLVTLWGPIPQQSPPIPQADPSVTIFQPTRQPQVAVQDATSSAVNNLASALTEALKNAAAGTREKETKTDKFIARQAVKMDLSPFDGNPEEWPIFYSQYNSVSVTCELSPVENLQRLQRGLKGEARECVRALLMSPENVEKIIEVLRKRYGDPEVVVQRLLKQAQQLNTVKEGDYGGILKFADVVRNLTATAVCMKCGPFLMNPQLMTELTGKLPVSLQVEWTKEKRRLAKTFADLKDFADWMEDLSEIYVKLHQPAADKKTSSENPYRRGKVASVLAATEDSTAASNFRKSSAKIEKNCRACGGGSHHLSKCDKFCHWTVEERWKWVRNNRYCFSCLNYGHAVSECRGKRDCGEGGCDKPHHRKLHIVPRIEVVLPDPPIVRTQTLAHTVGFGQINLNIVPVVLNGPKGSIETFAMLDPGANLTVLDCQVAERLGLQGPTVPLTHSGLHDPVTVSDSRSVQVTVSGRGSEAFTLRNVRTVSHLTLPRQSVKKATLQKWSHLKRLPITLYNDAQPEILIGQDNAHLCNTSELVLGPANAPAAGRTKLGWVLMGRVGASHEQSVSYHLKEETEDQLHQLVKYHFSMEAFGVKPNVARPRSREDARADEIMKNTLRRVGDRWEFGLLWKSDDPQLPSYSKETATRRLMSMERKMDSSSEFAAAYEEKIDAYLQKGYARKLTPEEAAVQVPKSFYLPHFMAPNPKKMNKLRFVFDAAAKTSGRSLNDLLLAGPDLVSPLPAVLFKFRQKAIAVTADVRDMFHRVAVKKEDVAAQRFLYRGMDRTKEPETYQMEVLIFGATCSPTIAQKAKNENAKLFSSVYPETSDLIIHNIYVDDYVNSEDEVAQAIKRFQELREVMLHGNFDLGAWLSNSTEFMASVPEDLRGKIAQQVQFGDQEATERVLGLFWKPVDDVFTFSHTFLRIKEDLMRGERLPAKKELLALVMSIYDPLGFISLFTVRGNMLLQDTWRTKIGWDDELPESLRVKWEIWRDGLKKIPEFCLKRCYSTNFSSALHVTLHVFVDASEQAYGAVAYFLIESPRGKELSLIISKARVAPLKPQSIPRMELSAAVLGSRLSKFIKDEHTVTINRTVYWSDSRTVLCWLQGDGRKFQQFVACRVGEIQELTNPDEWRWVPTHLNVADEMTRDGKDCDWSPDSRWVCGPSFLLDDEETWLKEKTGEAIKKANLEMKSEFLGAAVENPTSAVLPVEDYSSWKRLIRATCWLGKFCQWKWRMTVSRFLTPEDLVKAENVWIRTVQKECFGEELKCVKGGKPVSRGSKICHLGLFLDEDGILRLQGRLNKAALDTSTKCPVLLDAKHPYTRLLLSHHHQEGGHHGQERVVNELRQKYYMPHLRAAVRSTWTHCQQCKNSRAVPQPPLMGKLPAYRLEAGVFPFSNCGLDYFGPLEVTVGRRHEKRWGALFTCLSTRAVHLELAASLSTDSCIMAVRRFVGRRGCPRNIYSDNGTNFHGADNELKKALKELDQEKILAVLGGKSIRWHFNPPSAPHMGGSWERLVKSVKVALYATLKEQTPREEVLQTLLVEAEHSVNSHPLTHVSVDPEDPEALTPNHFLIGRSSNVAPPGLFEKGDLCSRKIWRMAQCLSDQFWKRWVREYLPTLQRRTKWQQLTKPVEVDDVAVEVDPQQPRNKWTMGRVTAIYPGGDGITRVVDWKTGAGTYRRPVAKLAFLDVKKQVEAAPVKTKDAAAASL